MTTYNEIVSRIQNTLNTVSKDTYIPRRTILSILKSKGEFLMAQRFNDKSLFRELNIFRWKKCIKMETIDSVKCGKIELEKCNTISISIDKLPDLVWTRYGASILMVTNITEDKEYKIITPSQYINFRKRTGFDKFKGRYAIIYPDNKIVIPDSEVKIIQVLLYTLDEKFDEGCDENNSCKSYWDRECNIPVKLREVLIQDTLKEISMRMQIPYDASVNGDSNQKTTPQNG